MLNPSLLHLRCFSCSTRYRPESWIDVCRHCGGTLRVEYDATLPSTGSVRSLWRYDRVLPVRHRDAVSLGEGWTPLVEVAENLWIKDEALNPTGSFKDRGMSVAVSAAAALGAGGLTTASAGNAAESLARYGSAAGVPVLVVMPSDTPPTFVEACRKYRAKVELIPGTISEAAGWLGEHQPDGYVNLGTLREPFRLEGKKTLAYELYEQLGGHLPDVLVFPTGGGTGIVGMWKAFSEMEQLGWTDSSRPRLVLVQSAGCAPIVRAYEAGDSETTSWERTEAGAHGLRVPDPFGGALCLRALRETSGIAVAVPDAELYGAAEVLSAQTGLDICPEGGGAWAAFEQLRDEGWISPGEEVVVFNTGAGRKYS